MLKKWELSTDLELAEGGEGRMQAVIEPISNKDQNFIFTEMRHHKSTHFARNQFFTGIRRFSELEQKIRNLAEPKERGDAFEVFVEAYLSLFRRNDFSEVMPLSSVPPSLLEKASLDSHDYGIDGMATDKEGNLSAYQVKFRYGRPALTWREVSTFMALADSPSLSHRILVTNCDELPPVMDKRFGFYCLRGSDFDRMEPADFEAIALKIDGRLAKRARKTPRPYQQDALNALIPALQKDDRVSAVMACGTGKTLVSLWLAENPDFKKIIVLLPSLALLRQTLHEWLRENSWESMSYISVCSDATVHEDDQNLVANPSHLDFPVTTDAKNIRKFLESNDREVKVVFTTYQSAKTVSKAMPEGESFDLGIFDEAHKTAGTLGKSFSHALYNENLMISKRVFLTATPRVYTPTKSEEAEDAKSIQSMDNPEIYGERAFNLNFGKAVDENIICPYKVLVTVITNEMVNNELLERGEVLVGGDPVKARVVANQIAIRKTIETYGPQKVFTFHQTVVQAQGFTGQGNESICRHVHDYDLYHVNGKMHSFQREKILKEFKNTKKGIISNARCLTEGVDVPAVDMVAFLSPKKSTVDIVQATGRAMRKSEGKEKGYILVPIYIELKKGESVEEAVERASFEEVWNVLQAMLDQDEELYHAVQQVAEKTGMGRGMGSDYFDDKIEITGGIIEIEDIVRAIRIRTLQEFFETWRVHLGKLISFYEEHGHYNLPGTKEYSKLRRWCTLQRTKRRRNKIRKEIYEALEEINFDWKKYEWEGMVGRLVKFHKYFHHFDVPCGYNHETKDLGKWVRQARQQRRKGKISKKLLADLKAIKFDWFGSDETDEVLEKLKLFKEKNGHWEVPADGKNLEWVGLAEWIQKMRKQKLEGTLNKELMYKLYDMRFSFVPRINIRSQIDSLLK